MVGRRVLLAAMCLAIPLAGCVETIGSPEPAGSAIGPRFVAHNGSLVASSSDMAQRFNVRVNGEGQADMPSIAVDPTNPNRLIVAARDFSLGDGCTGDREWLGVYRSSDGGLSWQTALLPGHDEAGAPGNPFAERPCATWPAAFWGKGGQAYVSGWSYFGREPPVPASKELAVAQSTDGGASFAVASVFEHAPNHPPQRLFGQSATAGPDGTLYAAWQLVSSLSGNLDAVNQVMVSRSSDGQTWSQPVSASGLPVHNDLRRHPQVAVDDAGLVHVVFSDGGAGVGELVGLPNPPRCYLIATSSDQGTSWSTPSVVHCDDGAADGRGTVRPRFAIDTSNSPHRGRLYVAWDSSSEELNQILVVWSDDGGSSWTEPMQVNDAGAGQRPGAGLPSIAVGPDGALHVAFLDTRDDPENKLRAAYYARVVDGVVSPNLRVSDGTHERNFPGPNAPPDTPIVTALAVGSHGRVHIVWPVSDGQRVDLMTATVVPG